jgi:hypothetical protein
MTHRPQTHTLPQLPAALSSVGSRERSSADGPANGFGVQIPLKGR